MAHPTPLTRRLKKLKRVQRAGSRTVKGSQNRQQAAHTLAKQHRTLAHQRAHALPQVTSRLAQTPAVVVSDDLNVAGMLTNHRLAQALADGGFAACRRHLEYTAAW